MEKQTFLEGWKTILTTITGAGGLAFADVPPHLLPYLTVIIVAAIAMFGAQGIAKVLKGGK